jgi:hypothetical protein
MPSVNGLKAGFAGAEKGQEPLPGAKKIAKLF